MKAGSVRKWLELLEEYDGPTINYAFKGSADPGFDPMGVWIDFVSPDCWVKHPLELCYLPAGGYVVPDDVIKKSKLKAPEWSSMHYDQLHGPSVVRHYYDLVASSASKREIMDYIEKFGHLF